MMELVSGNFFNVTNCSIILVWPSYNLDKHKDFQGFNSMLTKDRLEALTTIANIRHNIVLSCFTKINKIKNKFYFMETKEKKV